MSRRLGGAKNGHATAVIALDDTQTPQPFRAVGKYRADAAVGQHFAQHFVALPVVVQLRLGGAALREAAVLGRASNGYGT